MNRFMSVFSQLLQPFSRLDFEKAVKETNAERHARGFTCWGQFVAMLFCQLLTRCQAVAAGRRKFWFKNTLASLDASVIDLCATLFDWKDRWQIELLFKALKQHLTIKTFVGTSATALHTQIWTALIALLVLTYLQLRSTFGWSLSTLVALLQFQLFTHRDLWAWLKVRHTLLAWRQKIKMALLLHNS